MSYSKIFTAETPGLKESKSKAESLYKTQLIG